MPPSVSGTTPGATPLPNTSTDELQRINHSLRKALDEARQAHNVTKLALEEEITKRVHAEKEASSLLKTNTSLVSTVRMLSEIVKQNAEASTAPNSPASNSTVPKSTAFDSTASKSAASNSTVLKSTAFNSMASTSAASNITAPRSTTLDSTGPKLKTSNSTAPKLTASKSTGPKSMAAKNTDEVKSAEVYTAPQSILYDVLEHQKALYQQTGYPEGEQEVFDVTPSLKNDHGEAHDIETADTADNLTLHASQVPAGVSDTQAGTNASSSQALELRETTNRTICMPYQCRPNWAISQNRPIFESDQELAQVIRHTNGPLKHQSVFWQHPVRYLPASDEKNLCRTLIIDFLPLDTTMKDVLALIRGGALESIQLFGPIGCVTDFMTARVVFHYELPADDMLLYWQKYGLTVHGQPIRVLQLGYTYPKTRQLDEDVFMHCYTRILLIDNISDRVVQRLPAYLDRQLKMGFVVGIGKTEEGITMIEFTSVAEAAKAMRAMLTEELFHGAVFDFEDDYCEAGSYA